MNDQAIFDIQKNNNKVTRILNKICQKHPALTQEIDLALYSCLKIQKIIKKHNQHKTVNGNKDSHQTVAKNLKVESGFSGNEEDHLYSSALTVIEGFKAATKKLENKVGILLREQKLARQVQRAKQNNNINGYDEGLPYNPNWNQSREGTAKGRRKKTPIYEETSPFSPHIVENQSSKRKYKHQSGGKRKEQISQKKRRVKDYMEESESFQQMDEEQKSKNISELDLQIIELTSKIKTFMRQK